MHHFPMITLVENLKARCEPRKLAPKSRFLNFRVALTIVTDFQKFVHFYLVFKVSETKIFLFHFQRLIVCNYNFIFIPTFVCIPAVLFSYSSNQRSIRAARQLKCAPLLFGDYCLRQRDGRRPLHFCLQFADMFFKHESASYQVKKTTLGNSKFNIA